MNAMRINIWMKEVCFTLLYLKVDWGVGGPL